MVKLDYISNLKRKVNIKMLNIKAETSCFRAEHITLRRNKTVKNRSKTNLKFVWVRYLTRRVLKNVFVLYLREYTYGINLRPQ